MKSVFIYMICYLIGSFSFAAGRNQIRYENGKISITAGSLTRTIVLKGGVVVTEALGFDNSSLLAAGSPELSLSFYEATPNERPLGITNSKEVIDQTAAVASFTDVLKITGTVNDIKQNVTWKKVSQLAPVAWSEMFDKSSYSISNPSQGTQRLNIRVWASVDRPLNGVMINVVYEVYDRYPAIRKWIEISNNGSKWLKIDDFKIDDILLNQRFSEVTELTPGDRGASASIISLSNSNKSQGIILGSEVPSALRLLNVQGSSGYSTEHFEWVIGPGEKFVSEPTFMFAFNGRSFPTPSGVSTALDRTVEASFAKFLYDIVRVRHAQRATIVPQWCTWTNFGAFISDQLVRSMADIASAAGFKNLLIDAGWARSEKPGAWATSSTMPDPVKFPDFYSTSSYVSGKGMTLGLWVSCYRNPNLAADFKAIKNPYSMPIVKREEGVAMSFASDWKHYYANDIMYLKDRYNAVYFKQDLTNIKFGDIAEGHDSRTRKESLLRGLRGLFMSMDEISSAVPEVSMEITHEIYWGTPGVPCDIAALKHVDSYHVPPNDYSGAGNPWKLVDRSWNYNPDSLRMKLIEGCFNARKQLYAHRGLPLQSIEYYGAATVNFKGSLTERVQRRQVCSWLLGAPSVFAGDLATLTPANIATYRQCFDLLSNWNSSYGIYENFQFSGVPPPTDTDWHWWGKLNEAGSGVVVVMRGSAGAGKRQINIPWVMAEKQYQVSSTFKKTVIGKYTGAQLINGVISLELSPFDQEILEVKKM